jgi:hypothetical protein
MVRLDEVLQRCMSDIDVQFSFQIPPGLEFAKEETHEWTVAKVKKGSMADLKGIKAMWKLVGIRMTADGDNKQYAATASASAADDATKPVSDEPAGEQAEDDMPVLDQFTQVGTDAAGNIALVMDDEPGDEIDEIVDGENKTPDAPDSKPAIRRINVNLTKDTWRAEVLKAVEPALLAREAEEIATSSGTTDTELEWMLEIEKIKTKKIREDYNKFKVLEALGGTELKSKMRPSDAWRMLYSLDKPGDDECVR